MTLAVDEQQRNDDISTTNHFDEETGAKENETKRQVWRRLPGEMSKIEHLGIEVCPQDPSVAIIPAAGWGIIGKMCAKDCIPPGGAGVEDEGSAGIRGTALAMVFTAHVVSSCLFGARPHEGHPAKLVLVVVFRTFWGSQRRSPPHVLCCAHSDSQGHGLGHHAQHFHPS